MLGIIGSVVSYFVFKSAAEELAEEAAKSAVGGAGGGAGLSGGSAVCAKAAECCAAMVTKTGGDKAAIDACANMKAMPEVGCAQALETYKKAAPLAGFKCE